MVDEAVEAFSFMEREITIKDYFYYVSDQEKDYPEFWDKSKYDIRNKTRNKYTDMCLDDNCPIIGVSVEQIERYIKWLNNRTRENYSLMTESQWHYLGTYTDLDVEAWFLKNSNVTTHPVQSKKANKFGLYDVYGNVAEIVRTKDGYVAIGGSWKSNKDELKKKYRIKRTEKDNWLGFRLVKMKDKKDKK